MYNRLKDKQKLIHETEQVVSGKVSPLGGGGAMLNFSSIK